MTDPDIVTWLRSILHNDRSVELHCQEAANEIERLRKERDEARREICMILGGKGGRSSHVSPDAIDHARSRGWDCFAGAGE